MKGQNLKNNPELDAKVKKFLSEHSRRWYDMNVPTVDGQLLYDIIIKNNYKNALEIGTSTGHSGVWIAWALSKTGGKLTTIEIDEGRHRTAFRILGPLIHQPSSKAQPLRRGSPPELWEDDPGSPPVTCS